MLIRSGSPVKASSVGRKRKSADEDPRPKQCRTWTSYTAYVSSLVTNYCWNSSKDTAFRYLMPKANLQAAMVDHDYVELPFAEYWVDKENEVVLLLSSNPMLNCRYIPAHCTVYHAM